MQIYTQPNVVGIEYVCHFHSHILKVSVQLPTKEPYVERPWGLDVHSSVDKTVSARAVRYFSARPTIEVDSVKEIWCMYGYQFFFLRRCSSTTLFICRGEEQRVVMTGREIC